MELDSVRGLKRELIARGLTRRALAKGLPSRTCVAASARSGLGPRSDIALGVEKQDGEFLLAVRAQTATPEIRARLDEIRARARGEVSIRFIGRVVRQRGPDRWRPLQIGCSIGHIRGSAGTLGCFAFDGGAPLLLSNNHVLANENEARPGDSVVQPSAADGGREPGDTVARLSAFVPLAPMPARNRLDAAVARIEPGVHIAPGTLPGLGELAGVRIAHLETDEPVLKVGRTTGVTLGRVTATELDELAVGYEMGDLIFDGQIEISPLDPIHPFSRRGDSGALIVDLKRRAVALLFGGNGFDVTYANPIAEVLAGLDVRLL